MEEMTYRWSAKVPEGHMWLQMTFTIHYHDDDKSEHNSLTNSHIDDAGFGLSQEMTDFLNGCNGKTQIDRKEFIIRFADAEDFMRFNLIGMERRRLLG